MSQQRPGSWRSIASHTTKGLKEVGKRYLHPQAVILIALILGIAILGACGQEDEEEPAPEPAATSTATSLPVVVTYTPSPPTATNTPLPLPVETVSATPTPTVTATDAAPAAVAPPASDAKITVLGEMNIRSGPGIDYDVVGDATAGEEYAITGKNSESDWWQIDFRGESGWIYAPFVIAADAEDVPIVGTAVTEAPVPEEASTETSPTTQIPIATVGGDMNVRSGPGEEYDRIGGATLGEEFEITGKDTDGDWWRIDFDEQAGWIYASFVTATNAENVPIVGSSMTETPEPAAGTETGSPDAESPVVTILGDMNIREGPGTEYDRIGGATAGEEFTITGKSADGEWWQIDFDGEAGWIYAPYVTATNADNVPIVGDSSTETPVSTPVSSGAGPTPEGPIVTVGGDLNVRDGPGTEYDRIGGATAGEEFAVTGKSSDGEWWQIDFGGRSGWLYAPYVTATNAENVPVVAPTQQPEPTPTPETQGVNSADSGRRTVIARTSDGDALGVHFKEE